MMWPFSKTKEDELSKEGDKIQQLRDELREERDKASLAALLSDTLKERQDG